MHTQKSKLFMLLLFLLALALVLMACGGQSESDAPSPAEPSQEQEVQAPAETKNTAAPVVAEAQEGQDQPAATAREVVEAATVHQAAQLLDLRSLSLPDGAEPMGQPEVGSLNYQAAIGVADVVSFYQPLLTGQGWQVMEGQGYQDNTVATLYFTNKGFVVSLSASDMGGGNTLVTLMHHGNIDPQALPQMADAEQVTAAPNTLIYFSSTGVQDVANFVHDELTSQGWHEYSRPNTATADDPSRKDMHFIQNGLELSASVSEAPAQDGKTAVQYSLMLLPLDLPAATNAGSLEFDKSEPYLSYQTSDGIEALVAFYRGAMAETGWAEMADSAAVNPDQGALFFANEPEQVALMVEMSPADGNLTTVTLHPFEPADLLAMRSSDSTESDSTQIEEDEPGSSTDLPDFPLPEDAESVEVDGTDINFSSSSDIETVVEFYRDILAADGWQEQSDFSQVDDTFAFVEFDQNDEAIYLNLTSFGGTSEATIDLSEAPSLAGSAAEDTTAVMASDSDAPAYTISDWPVLPEAKEVKLSGDELSYTVVSKLAEVAQFYLPTFELMELDTSCLEDVADYTSISCSTSNGDLSVNFFAFEGFDDETEVDISFTNYALGSASDSVGSSDSGELTAVDQDGLPIPDDNTGYSSEGSKFFRTVIFSSPSDLAAILDFYHTELPALGWQLQDSNEGTDTATLAFTGPDGNLSVEATAGAETEVTITTRNSAAAKEAGILPPAGQARIYLVNFEDSETSVTLNGQDIKLTPNAGMDDPATAPKVDLSPGSYTVTIASGGSETLEVGADEVWGVMVGPGGALPLQMY